MGDGKAREKEGPKPDQALKCVGLDGIVKHQNRYYRAPESLAGTRVWVRPEFGAALVAWTFDFGRCFPLLPLGG